MTASIDLPKPLGAELERLQKALLQILGERLVSLAIYGSLARGEWQQSSDVNLLIVLTGVDFACLESIAPALRRARKKGRVVPMIVTREELAASADVFSVKFADIAAHHVVLVGDDPTAGLDIDRSELRFVVEFELRNVLMRLRQRFVFGQGDRALEQATLLRFVTSSMTPLRALLGLSGAEVPAATPDFVVALGAFLDADVAVLDRLLEAHRSGRKIGAAELTGDFEAFSSLIAAAVARADLG